MLNCASRVRTATSKFIIDRAGCYRNEAWEGLINTPIYVHWPTLVKELENIAVNDDKAARRILCAWEKDKLVSMPQEDEIDELPSIAELNNIYPDNVQVLCQTFGEYVNLRKYFGREDIGGITLDDV